MFVPFFVIQLLDTGEFVSCFFDGMIFEMDFAKAYRFSSLYQVLEIYDTLDVPVDLKKIHLLFYCRATL